ncbi:hypothetical protein L7F22_039604 [Adiantum nelumboides]|nr:hypothetical protein [Adiantum nelumboides]
MEEPAAAAPSLVTEEFLAKHLLDPSLPISQRFRALFSLRNLRGRGPREALISATRDSSNLLAHEAAFALGQMQDTEAISALKTILKNRESYHPIVRHEAAEALGAIGQADSVTILNKTLREDPAQEVKETCSLALRRIEQVQSMNDIGSRFLTVDPAMPATITSVVELRKMLLDENLAMYDRYAALFALRNDGGMEAVRAIISALQCQSALLKHEVAYVLGQLQNKETTTALMETLKDVNEHPMVRHEAAEALGAIAGFVQDRCISDNLFCLHQAMEWARSSSTPLAILLLDFEEAYDRVDWVFLEGSLCRMGFCWHGSGEYLHYIGLLLAQSPLEDMLDADLDLSRSMRQGCPLASYLFLFVVETRSDFIISQQPALRGLVMPIVEEPDLVD